VLRTAEGSFTHAFGPTEWGLLTVTAMVWGSSFLFIAEGLEAFAPGLITWLRLVLGVVTLAAFRPARRPVDRADWPAIGLLSVVWMATPFVLLPIAQQSVTSSLAGMINGSMPLFAAVFAAVLLRRLPGRPQLVGLAVGFVGVVLVSLPTDEATGTAGGIVLVLLTTISYSFAVNLAVPLQQRYGALPVLLRALLIAMVLTTPFGIAGAATSSMAATSALAVAALGVGGTGLAYVTMATLVGRAGATRGSIAVYFIPIVAIVLGVWLRNETVTPAALVGMALILVGAFATSRAGR
jgi:drug/metabolite transporter (DMT)-like permease